MWYMHAICISTTKTINSNIWAQVSQPLITMWILRVVLTSLYRKLASETKMNQPLKERLKWVHYSYTREPVLTKCREGCGALARHGEFWYPVRLIDHKEDRKKWQVRWWRGCEFAADGIEADSYTEVELTSLVDSLWSKRTERRKIRVSLFQTWARKWLPHDIVCIARKMAACLRCWNHWRYSFKSRINSIHQGNWEGTLTG